MRGYIKWGIIGALSVGVTASVLFTMITPGIFPFNALSALYEQGTGNLIAGIVFAVLVLVGVFAMCGGVMSAIGDQRNS